MLKFDMNSLLDLRIVKVGYRRLQRQAILCMSHSNHYCRTDISVSVEINYEMPSTIDYMLCACSTCPYQHTWQLQTPSQDDRLKHMTAELCTDTMHAIALFQNTFIKYFLAGFITHLWRMAKLLQTLSYLMFLMVTLVYL